MKPTFLPLLFLLLLSGACLAQSSSSFLNTTEEIVKETEFSIPSAPAFAMLDATPEFIIRPGTLRSFKVDWRIQNYQVAPDLALQAPIFWYLLYARPGGLKKFQDASPVMKMLSTLDLSFCTAALMDVNHMAVAGKINLYTARDPLLDKKYLKRVQKDVIAEANQLRDELRDLKNNKRSLTEKEEIVQADKDIFDMENRLRRMEADKLEEIKLAREEYLREHWNTTMVDLAGGLIYTYDNAALDSLRLQYQGYAVWVNGCMGIGASSLVSGVVRYLKKGDRNQVMTGVSYRYGSPRYNFFVETLYQFNSIYDPTIDDRFSKPEISLAYGGDFRLSRNILLNFALRTNFDQDFNFLKLIPVANIMCLMR